MASSEGWLCGTLAELMVMWFLSREPYPGPYDLLRGAYK